MGEEKLNEKELEELAKYVFKDIRIIDKCRSDSYKHRVKEDICKLDDPVNRVRRYQEIMGVDYKHKKPDAERWSIALDSYKRYPCFCGDKYVITSNYLRYENKKNKISINITADVLTGPSEIISPVENLLSKEKELKEALDKFCKVAYTIGNVCPVMKNGYDGDDTCWHKLKAFIEHGKEYTGFEDAGWTQCVSKREYKDIFAVFPEKLKGEVLVERLMLTDYYKGDYKLIIDSKPAVSAANVDEYINFLRLVTTLIVKRGIRIYYKNKLPEDLDLNETAENLISGLQKPACN